MIVTNFCDRALASTPHLDQAIILILWIDESPAPRRHDRQDMILIIQPVYAQLLRLAGRHGLVA